MHFHTWLHAWHSLNRLGRKRIQMQHVCNRVLLSLLCVKKVTYRILLRHKTTVHRWASVRQVGYNYGIARGFSYFKTAVLWTWEVLNKPFFRQLFHLTFTHNLYTNSCYLLKKLFWWLTGQRYTILTTTTLYQHCPSRISNCLTPIISTWFEIAHHFEEGLKGIKAKTMSPSSHSNYKGTGMFL